MRYDDRKLHSVTTGMFDPVGSDDGPMVVTTVYITVTSPDGEQSGPGIDVHLGIPASPDASLAALRAQAVQYAYEMIQRIAREPLENLKVASEKASLFRDPKE